MSVQPALPTEGTLDAEGRVAVDAPCVNCGYNLRTLKAEALCPECAQPVAYSIQGYFLRFAPPQWVRGLGRGLVLILIALGGAVIVLPAISLIIAIPTIVSASKAPGVPPAGPGHIVAVAQFIGQGLLVALVIVGLVRLTQPDPAQAGRAAGVTARRIIRFCCILLPIPTVVNLIVALCALRLVGYSAGSTTLPVGLGPTFPTFVGLGFASGLFAVALYPITSLALVRHLTGLLRRLPRPGLVRLARVEFWGLLISAALLLVGYGLMALTVFPTLGPLMAAATSMPSTMPSTMPTSLAAPGYVSTATGPATSLPTSMPGIPPLPPPSFFTRMLFVGGASAVGGCGSLVFGVVGVVLLIMSASAFLKAAREAESNAAQEVGDAGRDSRTSLL